jgi:hypothetical protein
MQYGCLKPEAIKIFIAVLHLLVWSSCDFRVHWKEDNMKQLQPLVAETGNRMEARKKSGCIYSSGCIADRNVIANNNYRFSGMLIQRNRTQQLPTSDDTGNNMAARKNGSRYSSNCA